jgi:putative integral membrane protein (TIGR02587 family)
VGDQNQDQARNKSDEQQNFAEHFSVGLARALGGAIIFALPMLMTMEMWWLGFYIERWHLVVLLLINIPLLVGLSYYAGFEETSKLKDDILDAFVAYGVGFAAAAAVLLVLAVIEQGMTASEVIGKISIQAVPGSIGALLARSELGGQQGEEQEKQKQTGYFGTLFVMLVGALFLNLNVAPTEEMMVIAFSMTKWHAIALAMISLLIMHAFVYTLKFQGQADIPPNTPQWSMFLRFTVVGYAIALLASLFMLWVFGRLEETGLVHVVMMTMVLGFPGAIGAAAARLIL